MIVRFGGGNSGVAEYLEKGSKYGRHYSRDELDNRIIIDGDLEVTDKIINDIADKGQERYIHITLSFNEPDITVEKMQAAYEDYKSLFLTAYKDGEINAYAEIHWPKTQQLLDKTTKEMYDRFPHIHMVIPKQNLLTGGYTNPRGLYDRHMNIWEALQEDVNNRHGLKSPAHSPRISLENYKAVLDRHKVSQFKSKDGDFKKSVFDTIEKQQVYSWQDFKEIVSSYGEIKVRNQGKDTEYYAVKLPNNDKFTNLNNPVFSKSYIEKREIPHKPLTQYQINNRLKQWEVVSKEIKYIDDASAAAKKAYRTLGDEQKVSFLKKTETHFYEEYDEKELPESNFRPFSFGSSDFEFGGGGQADRRSLHDLPSRLLVHSGTARGNLTRAELLLSDDEIRDLQFAEADSDAGLHGALQTTERVITDKTQIKSLSSQIIFDIEEGAAIATSNDLQLFKEIRTNLKPELVLAYAQANHLINPEEHTFFRAKDGSARIAFGKYNYNVSDFFTKGLGLEWKETEVILKSLYEAQNSGLKVEPVSNNTLKECLIGFEEDIYSVKLEAFKRVSNTIDKDESLSIKQINARYFTENRRISKLEFTTWSERENLKSINAFEKLVAEENLKAIMFGNRQDANAIKYPFSDHFEKYLTQQKVIDMSLINDLKEKYAKPKETENELENSIGGKGFDFVLNGKEAARRAKLTANLARQGQPNTRYGYSFKELTPNQQKDSVVFSHGGKKLFETKANRTKVLGGLDFDKTATALVYSMQRYGNPLDIKGTEKFREQIIEVAARNELKVEFTDPALNDALKVRLEELQLEAANDNSISAEDLELDKSLGERAAVDKAMLESKHREIEADLQQPNQAAVDLAAIAITQRLNAHEHEPITAETAALDTAVYNELKQTPALQAYFAVEMSKIGAANAEYRAEFIKNEPEEFMLANHAARKFTDELEAAYQANKPQEEVGLNLEQALLEIEELNQEEIKLRAEITPLLLDRERYYNPEFRINAPETEEMQPVEVVESKLKDAEKRLTEVLIKKQGLEQSVALAEIDELETAYQANKPQEEELDFNLDEVAIQPETPIFEQTTDSVSEPAIEQRQEKEEYNEFVKGLFEEDSKRASTLDIDQLQSEFNAKDNPEELAAVQAKHAAQYREVLLKEAELTRRSDSLTGDEKRAEFNAKPEELDAIKAQNDAAIEQRQEKEEYNRFVKGLFEEDSKRASTLDIDQLQSEFNAKDNPEELAAVQAKHAAQYREVLQKEAELTRRSDSLTESEAVFNSKTQDFIAQLESSEHLISYDESKTLSEQFAELKSGAASSLILEGNDNNQNFILIENAENGWQVTQGDAHFSADDFTEEDCPPEYIPFETSSFEEAVENMAQREGNLSMAEKLEQQQSESEAVFNSKTQDFIAQLESSEHLISYDESKTLSEQFAELKSGAASSLILEGNDNNQNFILVENTENGWQVTQGDAHFSADDFTEEDCPPEYIPFETSSFEEAVENMAQRESKFTLVEEQTQVFELEQWINDASQQPEIIEAVEKRAAEIFAESEKEPFASLIEKLEEHEKLSTESAEAIKTADPESRKELLIEHLAQAKSADSFEEKRAGMEEMARAKLNEYIRPETKGTLESSADSKELEQWIDDVSQQSEIIEAVEKRTAEIFAESEKEPFASLIEKLEEHEKLSTESAEAIKTADPESRKELLIEHLAQAKLADSFEEKRAGMEEMARVKLNEYIRPADGNLIKIEALETFEKEPAPLSVENAGDKHTANQISELKAPESEQEAKEIAETLSAGLKELRGKPELRQAALAAVALVDSSPLLQGEMAGIVESDNFVEVVLETTRTYSDDLQMTQAAPDVDMDM